MAKDKDPAPGAAETIEVNGEKIPIDAYFISDRDFRIFDEFFADVQFYAGEARQVRPSMIAQAIAEGAKVVK